ncbi:solute carrier family 66 member 3-like isoform X1 [Branchiostoma floridae x Branchiostoma belcheri]
MASVAIEVLVSFASLSCIVLCVVLKLPQIAAIWSSKSAKGVSLQSTLLEWFCYAVMMCYHFVNEYPLSTYAEYLFLNIQDLALVLIILYFQDRLGLEALLYITGYFIIVSVLSTSLAVAKIMINFVLPMSMASKLIQLRALWTSRDASSVSPTTWFIAFYSCVGPLSLCHLCSDLHNYCGNRRHPCPGGLLSGYTVECCHPLLCHLPKKSTEKEVLVNSKLQSNLSRFQKDCTCHNVIKQICFLKIPVQFSSLGTFIYSYCHDSIYYQIECHVSSQ